MQYDDCRHLRFLLVLLLASASGNLLWHIDGLLQHYSTSTANSLDILQSCTKPSIMYLNIENTNCTVEPRIFRPWTSRDITFPTAFSGKPFALICSRLSENLRFLIDYNVGQSDLIVMTLTVDVLSHIQNVHIKFQTDISIKTLLIFQGEQKHIFTFHAIPPYWHDTDSWKPSSGKTRTYIFYVANIMGAEVLATQGASASATMILTLLNGTNLVPAR